MSAMPAPKQSERSSRRLRRGFLCAALAAAAVLVAGAAGAEDTVNLVLDRATVMKMPEKVATLIIGNPLIADVSLQPGGVMVLTGKGYGVTNILALDRTGTVLLEKSVQVSGPREDVMVVQRGMLQESYSCAPKCERRITLGDDRAYFDSTLAQTTTRTGSAQGQAQPK